MANNRSFLKLPLEVFEKISNNGDFKARLSLRKTCKQFRTFVDESRCGGHHLYITVGRFSIKVRYDDHIVEYQDMGTGCQVLHNGIPRLIQDNDCVDLASADLRTVLGNPNTSIYFALIRIRDDAEVEGRLLIGLMENFYVTPASFKITVLKVCIEDNTLFFPILNLMSSNYLESLILENEGHMQFGQIIQTPQWLSLRKFRHEGDGSVSPDILQSVRHLVKFQVRSPISSQEGAALIGVLRQSDVFRFCRIVHMDMNFRCRELGEILGLNFREEAEDEVEEDDEEGAGEEEEARDEEDVGDEEQEDEGEAERQEEPAWRQEAEWQEEEDWQEEIEWRRNFKFDGNTDDWDIEATGYDLEIERTRSSDEQ